MDIPAATIDQVALGRNGKMVVIENDVCNIALQIREIDTHLRVRYSEEGGYFAVYWHQFNGDGSEDEHLVLTTTELDGRVVERIREIGQPDYDYAAELEREEEKARAAKMHEINERLGEKAEETHFALRKALGRKDRAFPKRPQEG